MGLFSYFQQLLNWPGVTPSVATGKQFGLFNISRDKEEFTMATASKEQLQQRINELEQECTSIQQQIDSANKRAEQADRLLSEATRKYDLEGNDQVKPDIERHREEKATAQAEVQKYQAIREAIPARLAAIRLELDHLAHRSDLQLLVELKRKEQEAFLAYEQAAVALLDSQYTFKLRRAEREQVAQRVTDFARSHNTPAPSNGNFGVPYIDVGWNDPRVTDSIKAQFAQTKREFS